MNKSQLDKIFRIQAENALADLTALQWIQRFNRANPEHAIDLLDRLPKHVELLKTLCAHFSLEYKDPDALPILNTEFQNFPNFPPLSIKEETSGPLLDREAREESWGEQLDREAKEEKREEGEDYSHGLG